MGTTLKIKLSSASLKKAAKEVRRYADDLEKKNRLFVEKLIDRGIEIAKWYAEDTSGTFGTHQMGNLVSFSKEITDDESGCVGLLVGMGKEVFSKISEGRSINSLLALEFGTAGLALPPQEAFHGRGGQGTNSESGHENDLVWFVFEDVEVNGEIVRRRKKLSAIDPTRPMYHAAMEMLQTIQEVAMEVFATNREIEC